MIYIKIDPDNTETHWNTSATKICMSGGLPYKI